MKKTFLFALILASVFVMIGSVSATHTSTVSLSPSGWLKPNVLTQFNFTVTNVAGNDINHVVIQLPVGFTVPPTCEDVTGWIKTSGPAGCTYDALSQNNIKQGASRTFNLMTTTGGAGEYSWTVDTSDTSGGPDEQVPVSIVKTIQSAINGATSGDVISVLPGTYNENITLNKSVTLDGNGATLNGKVMITSDNVVLKNFVISPTIPLNYANSDNKAAVRIDNSNIIVEGNTIENVSGTGAGSINAIYITSSNSDNITLKNNIIRNIDNTVKGSYGIMIQGEVQDVSVINNEISGITSTGWAHAIEVTPTCSSSIVPSDVVVTGNSISDVSAPSDAVGFSADWCDSTGLTANASEITFNNNLLDNVKVRNLDTTNALNATNNWWGTSNETEIRGLVSANVDYDPWWYGPTNPADTSAPSIAFGAMDSYVKTDQNLTVNATVTDDRNVEWYHIDFGDGSNGTSMRIWERNLTTSLLVNHTYDSEGKYLITISARDEAGNVNNSSIPIVVTSENPDWVINLNQGANLISIPFTPASTDYKDVFDGVKSNLDRIWAYVYDPTTQQNVWKYKYYNNGWYGSTGFNDIVPGRGYFVFMKNSDILYGNKETGSSDSSTNPATPPEVQLANGYNLIGVFGNQSNSTTSLLHSLTFGGDSYWSSVMDMGGTSVSSMNSQEGYWIFMKHLPSTTTSDYYSYTP